LDSADLTTLRAVLIALTVAPSLRMGTKNLSISDLMVLRADVAEQRVSDNSGSYVVVAGVVVVVVVVVGGGGGGVAMVVVRLKITIYHSLL